MNRSIPRIPALVLFTAAALGTLNAAQDQPRKKEKRPLAAVFVKSKEWKLLRLPEEVEELTGDVYYRQGDRQVKADWARLARAKGLWDIRGNIQASFRVKDGDVVEILGHRARHDEQRQTGWMAGKNEDDPVFLRYFTVQKSPETQAAIGRPIIAAGLLRDSGSARTLDWNEPTSKFHLKGNVHFEGQDGQSWSEEATYDRRDRTTVLTGRRPVLTHDDPKWIGALQADRVAAAQNRQRMDADGRVKGWLRFKDHDPLRKKS